MQLGGTLTTPNNDKCYDIQYVFLAILWGEIEMKLTTTQFSPYLRWQHCFGQPAVHCDNCDCAYAVKFYKMYV